MENSKVVLNSSTLQIMYIFYCTFKGIIQLLKYLLAITKNVQLIYDFFLFKFAEITIISVFN